MSDDLLSDFQVLLKNEIVSLKECVRLTDLLKTAVMNRDAAALKTLLSQLSREAGRLKMIEERRVELYARICRRYSVREKSPFYDLLPFLPESRGSEIAALYRELKSETVLYQGRLKNLDDYVYSVTGTLNTVMEAYSRRNSGGVYNQTGQFPTHIPSDHPVFISTEL